MRTSSRYPKSGSDTPSLTDSYLRATLPGIPDSTIITLCGWCRAEVKPGVIRCASCGATFQGRERVPQLRIGVKLDSPPLSPGWEDDEPPSSVGGPGITFGMDSE